MELHVTYETIIPYIRRRNLENDEIEMIWVEIRIENQSPFFVGVVYRKPDCSSSFCSSLESSLDQVFSITDNVIVLGDTNCNTLTNNSLSNKVTNLCSTFHLTQLIQEPTRIIPCSKTLIDVICVSSSMFLKTKTF